MNDGNVTAQALYDLKHMGSEENGGAAGNHALQHCLQRAGGNGVDTFERLVEKENLRPMNHRSRHGELLLHAMGVIGHEFFWLICELHEVEQLDGPLGGSFAI